MRNEEELIGGSLAWYAYELPPSLLLTGKSIPLPGKPPPPLGISSGNRSNSLGGDCAFRGTD